MIDSKKPLVYGLGEASFWTRNQKINLWSEKNRWLSHVESVAAKFSWCKIIHVSDRETDSYEYLAGVIKRGCSFVTRACHMDRKVNSPDAENISDEINLVDFNFTRAIEVSKRAPNAFAKANKIHPPRTERKARVRIGAKPVILKRSQWMKTKQAQDFPKEISVNMVVVLEETCEMNESPIKWVLFTQEPIETEKQIERVIEIYRKRWTIEEFFKALKTGCSAENRLFNSLEAWLNATALLLPIVPTIMNLRNLNPLSPLSEEIIFNKTQIEILRKLASNKGRDVQSVSDAVREIARLGGYVNRSKPPRLAYLESWLAQTSQLRSRLDAATRHVLESQTGSTPTRFLRSPALHPTLFERPPPAADAALSLCLGSGSGLERGQSCFAPLGVGVGESCFAPFGMGAGRKLLFFVG